MGKSDEINYISKVAEVEGIPVDEFGAYLMKKPFSDPRCGEYLVDIAQVIGLLPPPPGKLLDVGVGSGWTSELFARRGYEVLGVDVSPEMLELARRRELPNLSFACCDYESSRIPAGFDVAVIYDSLHHAEDEMRVIQNIFDALNDGGVLVTVEPGSGHSRTEESRTVMQKYGTTEKDMPFSRQRRLMTKAGFARVDQYARISQLQVSNLAVRLGVFNQVWRALLLAGRSTLGLTSIVVATKARSRAARR
jgi:SAM-dependent methyltransferase